MLSAAKNFLKVDLFLSRRTFIQKRSASIRIKRTWDSKPVEIWKEKNLKETLEHHPHYKKTNPELTFKVDIGLPPPSLSLSKKLLRSRHKIFKERKKDPELEKKARNLTQIIDTDSIREEWVQNDAPRHIQMVAEHYNVFNDLFGDAYFTPYIIMDIYYPQINKNMVAPVCRGNVVKPEEAFLQPVVKFSSKPEELWTLTLVNPDGNLTDKNMEYVHWFLGNIPGGDVSKGEVIQDYLPPFPPRGTGFQRLIFVLYKQERKIDYSSLKKEIPCLELKDRSFKTLKFYRERQNDLTPAGLSFFQSDWDKTARKIFHEILNMEEPVYEYDFELPYHKAQKKFPKGEPFNRYLDNYKDPRDLNQEFLVKMLKEVHPFKPPKKPFPYPKAIRQNFKDMPSWLMKKEQYYKMKRGRVSNLEREEYE